MVGVGRNDGDPPEMQYLYRKKHILVREQYLEPARQILLRYSESIGVPRTRPTDVPDVERVVAGVRLLRLDGLETLDALRVIRDGEENLNIAGLGSGCAAPDYVVHISGDAANCPANEPEPVSAGGSPVPPPAADPGAGAGVKVLVIDTGLDNTMQPKAHWLHGVTGEQDRLVKAGPPRTLEPYAGHGTFIAGVVRSVAPRAEVRVLNYFPRAGATWESTLVQNLDRALHEEFPDIISMSAGTRAQNGGLLAFNVFWENRLSHYKGVALVVAAGNDGERSFFWPAASPYTVSVGALAPDGRSRADFSNFGGWVDVYAPGQDLVNAFPNGKFTYQEPPHVGRVEQFSGMAMWSGTSFSTPLVAGLIAARMSRTGENGRAAAAALLAQAREQAVPGVGAVLLP
ncbi:S8/S53 family peptidase [Phytohabitans rumicis]|uniref:Peptidase S8/S53 domain-containing protein n=1 Tax=Phytohabitans rumicis TaxID=1076125 RepID=A0A6V8LB20_9ACTN|nr:S8/S53 family peptidase [Phytohabitans rumicis]GFJ94402.1 hypothetical protein Prum_080440 [Phytohabitans rumicis]